MKKQALLLALAAVVATGAYAQGVDTLAKIKERGVVNLGVRDSSGLAYTLGNGKYVGFHTEMAERIIKDLSKDVGKPLTINYQVITSQNRVPLVQNGTIDFECGSTTNNAARQKDVDFAYTTYVEEIRILTKKNSGIKGIADLKGKTVVTTTGTTSVQTLRKNKRAEGIDFKEVMGKDHADSFLLLESGRADAFVMDGSILAANAAKSKDPKDYQMVGEVLSTEPIACMMPKGDPKLKKAIDDSIARQIKDGSLAKLYDKWFMQPIPPNNVNLNMPASEGTKNAWAHPNDKPMEDYVTK
jgi:glutamate/aspartate transport system substrate-binding protein